MLERVGRRKGNHFAKCGAVASADPGKWQRKTYTRAKGLMSWIVAWECRDIFDYVTKGPCFLVS